MVFWIFANKLPCKKWIHTWSVFYTSCPETNQCNSLTLLRSGGGTKCLRKILNAVSSTKHVIFYWNLFDFFSILSKHLKNYFFYYYTGLDHMRHCQQAFKWKNIFEQIFLKLYHIECCLRHIESMALFRRGLLKDI